MPSIPSDRTSATLEIKVIPNASVDEIVGWEGDRLKIRIRATPTDGKANQALIAFLARKTGIRQKSIKIKRGQTGRQKWIAFKGIDRTALLIRLEIPNGAPHGQETERQGNEVEKARETGIRRPG